MSRPKEIVPVPAHIKPEAIAKRKAKGWSCQHKALLAELDKNLAAAKPKLRVILGTAAARAIGIR